MAPISMEKQQAPMMPNGASHVDLQGLDFTLYVQAALDEIKAVPPAVIHRESALRWSARAVASYRICAESTGHEDRLCYLYLGEHYREAALAHASMGEPWEPLYTAIDEIMEFDRTAAFDGTLAAGAEVRFSRPPRRNKKSGKAAMASGKAAMDSGKAAMDSGKAAMDSGKAAMDSGKAAMDSGKAARNSGKAAMDSGRAAMDSR